MHTSTLLISRHTLCFNAPRKTKSIKESIPKPWETTRSMICKQERLSKKSWNEWNAAKSKVCNERGDQRRIWTFEQERKQRYSVEQYSNSNVEQASSSICSPSCLEWFSGSSGSRKTVNSLRALKVLPSIQDDVERRSSSHWRV